MDKKQSCTIEQRIENWQDAYRDTLRRQNSLIKERVDIVQDILIHYNLDGYVYRKSDHKLGKLVVENSGCEFYPMCKSGTLSKMRSTTGLPYSFNTPNLSTYIKEVVNNFEPATDY